MNEDINTKKRIFRLSIIGYTLIAIAVHEYYRSAFFGILSFPYIWIFEALAGVIILLKKLMIPSPEQRFHQIRNDLIFLCPIACLMILPVRKDISLICILVYVTIFFLVFAKKYEYDISRGR